MLTDITICRCFSLVSVGLICSHHYVPTGELLTQVAKNVFDLGNQHSGPHQNQTFDKPATLCLSFGSKIRFGWGGGEGEGGGEGTPGGGEGLMPPSRRFTEKDVFLFVPPPSSPPPPPPQPRSSPTPFGPYGFPNSG